MSTPTSERPVVLELDALVVGYARRALLPPLTLEVRAGEIWALVGRNGGGKSTLARTVLGLQPPVSGRCGLRPGVAASFVPQRGDYDLSVPSRVIDIVRGGVDHGLSFLSPLFVRRRRSAVDGAMELTDVSALRDRQFAELSEGQKQRVLMARALVSQPGFMILDEPTSAMDPVAERAQFELIERLAEQQGVAVMVASHTMAFVPRYATGVILVDADHDLAEAGPTRDIMQSEAFAHRYGSVLDGPGGLPPMEAAVG